MSTVVYDRDSVKVDGEEVTLTGNNYTVTGAGADVEVVVAYTTETTGSTNPSDAPGSGGIAIGARAEMGLGFKHRMVI
jgi:hypothetical protein